MNDSMKYLIPVGFYRELRGGRPHEPSLRDAVQLSANSNEPDVIRYLNAGKVLIATSGIVSDVLDPKFGIIGAPHVLTDGTYAWPAIFAHYVQRHHVQPPGDFVSYMIANNWVVPPAVDVLLLRIDRDTQRSIK